MALHASSAEVGTGQGECGQGVVDGRPGPTRRSMASSTVLTKLATMPVIRSMAGHAILRRAGVGTARMALHARSPGMSSRELEGGASMVKDSTPPGLGSMAFAAVLAKLAPVLVIRGVASHAILGCTSIAISGVALDTRSAGMGAVQRKCSQAMVNGGA
jgi:hypothetical protein